MEGHGRFDSVVDTQSEYTFIDIIFRVEEVFLDALEVPVQMKSLCKGIKVNNLD